MFHTCLLIISFNLQFINDGNYIKCSYEALMRPYDHFGGCSSCCCCTVLHILTMKETGVSIIIIIIYLNELR